MKRLTERDYRISDWSGGKTIQIAIGPEGAEYADRSFLWRLSSATVDLDESDFTALPDYMRWIAPIRGEMRLTHNGGAPLDLAPYEAHLFDGADDTHSWGRCTDFNLMLRKGRCTGTICALGSGEAKEETFVPDAATETLIVYCTEGGMTVAAGEDSVTLGEREAAVLERPVGPLTLTFTVGGRAMAAAIRAEA